MFYDTTTAPMSATTMERWAIISYISFLVSFFILILLFLKFLTAFKVKACLLFAFFLVSIIAKAD